VLIGFLGGPKADGQSLMSVMLKRLVVTGSTLRSQTDAEKVLAWPLLLRVHQPQ